MDTEREGLMADSNKTFKNSLLLLVEHHDLLVEGEGESEEAGQLEEEMAGLWLKCSKEENEIFKALSARLMQVQSSIKKPPI